MLEAAQLVVIDEAMDTPLSAPQERPPAAVPAMKRQVKAEKPAAKIAKVAAHAPVVQAAREETTPPPAAKEHEKVAIAAPAASAPPAVPVLDIAALEQRLKETKSIGMMVKLNLKSQVDELIGRFRAFHHGHLNTTLAALRPPYDTLLLKVVSLVQEGDPDLAHSITASREAIWVILADRAKFDAMP